MAHCNGSDICMPTSLWGDWNRARVCGCECDTCLTSNLGMGVLRGQYVRLAAEEPRMGGIAPDGPAVGAGWGRGWGPEWTTAFWLTLITIVLTIAMSTCIRG